jgi:hypothetical protein
VEHDSPTTSQKRALHRLQDAFECLRCHAPILPESEVPACKSCGDVYQYDPSSSQFRVQHSRARVLDYASLALLALAVLECLVADRLTLLGWSLGLVGYALHYYNGIRTGVLGSRFFIFSTSWVVYRAESPTLFDLAIIVEGILLAALTFAALASL